MISKRIFLLFNEIGIDNGTALIYQLILSKGPASKEYLQKKTGVNEKKLSKSLDILFNDKLIFEYNENIWAFSPKQSFTALADDFIWSRTNTLDRSLPKGFIYDRESLEGKKKACQLLKVHFIPQYTYRSPVSINQITVAKNADQIASLMVQAFIQAKEIIRGIGVSPELPQLSIIWETLISQMRKGVQYERIISEQEIKRLGLAILFRDVEEAGVDLYIVKHDRISQKYYVIDDNCAVMFYPDRIIPNQFCSTGQIIGNRFLVKKFLNDFQQLLSGSMRAKDCLQIILGQSQELIERANKILNKQEMLMLSQIINFGNFAKFPSATDIQKNQFYKKCLENSLLVPEIMEIENNKYLPNYELNIF